MSKVKYTKEQNKVIYTRNRNLLVSAAAGSGKTAVLVERIIQMITDKNNPIDIDKILVVTFTNAAAAEMRERIGDAIEKKLEDTPNNKFLHKQLILLPNANIMTIHAFCLNVIKDYFHLIDLDPSFRVGDETEIKLLKTDTIKDLLEIKYSENNEDFIHLVDSYSNGKTDEMIEELIINVHNFLNSNPWPEDWINEMVENLNIDTKEDLYDSVYYNVVVEMLDKKLIVIKESLIKAKELSTEEYGPEKYLPVIEEYLDIVNRLIDNTKSLENCYTVFSEFSPKRLSSATKGIDPQLKKEASELINYAKDELNNISVDFFNDDIKVVIEYINGTYKVLKALSGVTIDFSNKYQESKIEKNIIDFNDIEHYALQILVNKDESAGYVQTEAARNYMEKFEEILIDEYQDSNLVQESILEAVSRKALNKPNMFMVGDIKQSIYKFRLAKPELFLHKYNTYSESDSKYQKIDLQHNFRSKKEIIDAINFLFVQIMSEDVGDINYNDKVSLNLGMIENQEDDNKNVVDIILIDKNNNDNDEDENVDITSKELEAKAIGIKIKELVNKEKPLLIYDKSLGKKRPVKYKDIVILLRTTSGWTDVFIDELNKMSIPTYTDTTTGYFDTIEIRTIVNLLRIIDNPLQDIPLLSVLRSPIVGLRGEELVKIRKCFEEGEFFAALKEYTNLYEEDSLIIKINSFLKKLKKWREISSYTSIDELILKIYEETNYYYYVSLMNGGKQRQANLDLFVDKASLYESSSYKGLFNFIRYIDNIQKYSIDSGEISVSNSNDNLVRVMSIHKSKGLEYPVVIVAGLGKNFNKMDILKPILLHQDLGFGVEYINLDKRYKVSTLPRNIIKEKISTELMSEEMRVLYVALTRAREKLILIGSVNDIEKKSIKWCESLNYNNLNIPSKIVFKGTSFIDWIMACIVRHRDGKIIRDFIDDNLNIPVVLSENESNWNINIYYSNDLTDKEKELMKTNPSIVNEILEDNQETPKELYVNKLEWKYKHNNIIGIEVSKSVSDIKRTEKLEELDKSMSNKDEIKIVPKFLESEMEIKGSQRGTIIHKVMYYLDINLESNFESVNDFLNKLVYTKIINEKEKKAVYINKIIDFLNSPLANRMREANNNNKLNKEKPFVLGVPVNELYENINSSELIMIQGVIDAYFEEKGSIILVDYKTDYVIDGQELLLIDRYKKQMEYYKRAIEQVTNKSVKEVIIYSLTLSKEIRVNI